MINEELVRTAVSALPIELPSWGFGNAGTRFGVFPEPGCARDVFEKIEDAGTVHRLTGASPSVALHIPWDLPPVGESWEAIAAFAKSEGVKIGAINPNLFQDPDYKLGSLCNPDAKIRQAVEERLLHLEEGRVGAR